MASAPLMLRHSVRCGACQFPVIRDLPIQDKFEDLLLSKDWTKTKVKGWVCGSCMGSSDRLSPGGVMPRRDQLLKMLRDGADWKPTQIARDMGISRQRVYKMRDRLVEMGLLENHNGDQD